MLKLHLPGDGHDNTVDTGDPTGIDEDKGEGEVHEPTEHGNMLKIALDSGDGAAIHEAVKRIMGSK